MMDSKKQPAGAFITFEGPEGSGKTTQIQRLAATLRADRHEVITTREPGGTALGNAIRTLLLEQTANHPCARAEALLFNAARAQLVDEVIRPALARSCIILCDRYADSTLAYQGYGRKLDLTALHGLTDFATAGLKPDLTIFLDIDPQDGLQRKRSAGQAEWNRLDAQTLAFHRTVRRGYLELAQKGESLSSTLPKRKSTHSARYFILYTSTNCTGLVVLSSAPTIWRMGAMQGICVFQKTFYLSIVLKTLAIDK